MAMYIPNMKPEQFYDLCKEHGLEIIAVPVPSHGRLGDLDALEQDAQKRLLMCDKNDNQFQKPYEVMRAIALAPTIIPAEPAEEGQT